MRKTDAFRRAAALMAALSITVSLAAPAFAGTYYIDYGDIIITKKDDGSQEIKQNGTIIENDDRGEIIITTVAAAATTQESDLEGPAAEDSGFGPVVEDNYQPAQPEDAEQPKDADQPEDAEEPEGTDQPESTEEPKAADRQESAGQQAQPQQAAPAAAPAASTPQNDKGNGFWGNTITVINKAATALKLTLKDVKIDVSDTGNPLDDDDKGNAALSVQGEGDVEIELDGKNELKSGAHRAGLEKTSKGTLTLKDDKKDDNKKAGSLKATGGKYGAGIGGGINGSGINVTVSGAAQVTATASKSDDWDSADTGATIGNGGSVEDGDLVNGEEIQADISGLTTGYIHHIICDENGNKVKEWWEPERPQPNPEGPNAPAEESNGVSLGTPVLHVETLEGDPLPFNAQQQGSTLRVTTDNLAARLHGNREALEALREQGVEQIEFVTSLKTTTLSVAELLAEGGSWFALEHDGLVSRRLSAAQAESLKCWMH